MCSMAIEDAPSNADLRREVARLGRDLTEAREQQSATAEVLKVISRSAFDLDPVLETLVENAAKLCVAQYGLIYRFDGESFRLAATYNVAPDARASVEQNRPVPGPVSAVGRAALVRRTVQIPDILADPEYDHPIR